jgi:hypothetical protein
MKKRNRTVIRIMKPVEMTILEVVRVRGVIIPVMPIIRKILAIFEPMILPATIFPRPFRAAERATPNSGRDVPRATKLSPITESGIFKRFAKNIAPSTSRLAPNQIATMLKKTTPRCFKRRLFDKGFSEAGFDSSGVS